MKSQILKIVKGVHFDESLSLPAYQTEGAAGADLCACFEDRGELVVNPGERVLIPTGLFFEIPAGLEVQIRPRSGLSFKTTLFVVNSPGTIDSDYRGEIKIIMGNWGQTPQVIKHGDRVAQMVVAEVVKLEFQVVNELSETARASGGFGSTGIQRNC